MATVLTLIQDAMMEIGALAAGETARAEDAQFALRRLNNILSNWRTRRLYVYAISGDRYTLTPSQTSHTVGPSGADFTAARPTRIDRANIVLAGSSPEVHVPLEILTDEQWQGLSVPEIGVSLPTKLYNDRAYPKSTLYLYGYPTVAHDLELFTWQQVSAFASLGTAVTLPDGYELALQLSLAEALCNSFGKRLTPELEKQARGARSAIQSLNTLAPRIETEDDGVPGGGWPYFNYRTGGLR